MTAEYVTDTHSLLWHLYLPKRVGRAAREVFSKVDAGEARIHIPAVVIAEALMVVQKGRLPGVTLSQLLPQIEVMRGSDNYLLSPLLPQTVLQSLSLASVPDIFDRLIGTEAMVRGLPLLSRDPNLRSSGLIATIWD